MRNLKKYLLSFVMIMPMIVLLAHDIIPHHHHGDHGHVHGAKVYHHDAHSHVSDSHSHHDDADHHHNHANLEIEKDGLKKLFFEHHHEKEEEKVCFLTHHRVQKELKYEIFLDSGHIDYGYREISEKKKYYELDSGLLPEPIKLLYGLRAPPALA